MTRINTNVSSLIGRNNLGRANASLSQSLTRLSTGLRINTGKDDPAGLIASENLRSDITSIKKAISNTDRANQVIATADSALGQVSSLLNDIRGLVTESANAGALSDEQIAANQLQIDSSLEALNRIAQTTTFQGRRLLDGSLDFITQAGNADFSNLSNLQIDQANLGATGQVNVDVEVQTAATKAQVNVAGITAVVPGSSSTGTLTFSDGALAASAAAEFDIETTAAQTAAGSFELEGFDATGVEASVLIDFDALTNVTGTGIAITATVDTVGTANNGININFIDGGASGTATAVDNAGTLDVTIFGDTTADELETLLDGASAGAVTFSISGASGNTTAFDTLDADLVADLAAATYATASGTDNATLGARTLDFATTAGGGRNFDVTIQTDTTANIAAIAEGAGSVTNAGDTVNVQGTAASGFTITIADDAAVDLATIASDIQTAINGTLGGDGQGDNVSVTLGGGTTYNFDLRNLGSVAPNEVGGGTATTVSVTGSADAVTETLTLDIGLDSSLGANPNGVAITFTNNAPVTGTLGAANDPTGRVAVSGDLTSGLTVAIDNVDAVSFDAIVAAIGNVTGVNSVSFSATGTTTSADNFNTANAGNAVLASQGNTTFADGRDAGDDVITITADSQGAEYDGALTVDYTNATANAITVTRDSGTGAINVSLNNTSAYNIADIASAITSQLDGFTASVTTTDGSGTFDLSDPQDGGGVGQQAVAAALTGGQATTGGLAADAVIELAGSLGSEVFNLKAGTSLASLVEQINLVSDATGVEAAVGATTTTLEISSTTYGSKSIVDLSVRSEGTGGTFAAAGLSNGARDEGTDVVATVNGIAATGDGNKLSINTSTLDLSTTVTAGYTGTASFTITGGGALFQLGPDVVSNQQARLGITSVNTAALGGVNGNLYQLGTGGDAELQTDPTTAARIVEEAIDQVTSLRGRLGAFQRTTLETNKNALNDTLANLTEAESSIRDADFAEETANLTRSQILVQSGTRVLAIANQNPQNVLALLG